jgi:hypothetical protein
MVADGRLQSMVGVFSKSMVTVWSQRIRRPMLLCQRSVNIVGSINAVSEAKCETDGGGSFSLVQKEYLQMQRL